ncbi:MAG: trypsin-like serine protease [Deltaproteobacteria bacterium]|nr:trypsin-like serine protease [Deltaproteobacteria bacterium]
MHKLVIASLLLMSLATGARADHTGNIVGGTEVPRGAWREVVAVLGRFGTCTGTLIAPDVVLTAGHCIDASPYEVAVDTIDYAKPGGQRIAVASARAYPDWQERYDVGILMLDHVALPRPATIAAACTAKRGLVEGAQVRAVGFGVTSPSGDDDNTALHEVELPVRDPACTTDAACIAAIAPGGELIAGGRGRDSCFGDSGGPVFLDTAKGPVLAGVVSRGVANAPRPCGGGGIYVRADKVMTWVKRTTGRTFARSACDAGPADDGGADEEVDGGCSTGRGAGPLGVGSLLAIARRRRRGRVGRA